MKETKSVSVDPRHEQTQIDLWADFGWTLLSSQEIFSRESHLEGEGDNINSVTTTTNYVKLVFQRDTEMKNYKEIRQIEKEFDAQNEVRLPGPNFSFGWFILSCMFGLGIVLFILLKIANKDKKKQAIAHNEEVVRNRIKLREKSRALVYEE